MKNVNNKI